MNHVVLIGNGFDLAHRLKTSYIDFLTWYLKNIAESIEEKQVYEDDIIKISYEKKQELNGGFYLNLPAPIFQKGTLSDSPSTILQTLKDRKYTVTIKSYYFEELFNKIQINTWVDVEILYYSWLKRIYNSQFKANNSKSHEIPRYSLDTLNKSFKEIKNKLEKYLSTITDNLELHTINDIENHFKLIISELNLLKYEKICVINFNYTNTINLYLEKYNNIEIINIHGNIYDNLNPIVFGYGDETDELYKEIENINDNNYLQFMKSFGYFNSTSYQDLIKFIDADDYTVHIMGHSCGLSDRVLLKKIFENDLCKKIKINFYQKNEYENDFTYKCMEISRHFSSDKKDIMREKIMPIDPNFALVKFNKIS